MQPQDWEQCEITLSVDGLPLRLNISVPAKAVKPQVMLPVFQNLANAFTDMAVRQSEAAGDTISCRKGCGACCRQPIPLMEVEIYYIAIILNAMPEPRRTQLRARFKAAAAHFRQNGWQQRFEDAGSEAELRAANRAYFSEGIACPFLDDESCSIYKHRPVVCREFMVTSPVNACIADDQEAMRKMPVPLSALSGLSRLGKTGRLSKGFLPMIFAPQWTEQHPESFPLKTGREWLAEFFGG